MTTTQIVLGIILIIASVFLITAVLMQQGKNHNLSGTIAGGAETFFGKSKAQTIDKKLSKWTSIIAIIFVIIVLVVYLMQDSADNSGRDSSYVPEQTTGETTGTEASSDETGSGAVTDAGTGESAVESTAGTEA